MKTLQILIIAAMLTGSGYQCSKRQKGKRNAESEKAVKNENRNS